MEPPRGFLASLWNFICFLPYFIGLLLLGTIKGIILCPFICLLLTVGNTAIILGLWPAHFFWTYYSILRSKQLGPVLKLVLCLCIPGVLIPLPVLGFAGSVIGGAAYGFLSPIFATFDAVGEGKTNELFHCFYDGTWSTIKGSLNIVRDFWDVSYYSYFSIMHDLRHQEPTDGKYYEIRLLYLPGALIAGVLGFLFDFPAITIIAICKSPYMLFKGWHRLFHDLIGREGPFLETICVPFAGLAVLLWPLAVAGAVLGSIVSSIFIGAYAGVVVYQESSLWMGLCYIIASLSIYDEYSNDILDMPEGSCFPRPKYRKNPQLSRTNSLATSKGGSVRKPPSRSASVKVPLLELKPLELLDGFFKNCQLYGESMVSRGVITPQDIEDAKSSEGSQVISTGLPAYCLLQTLICSMKANSSGIIIDDNGTELTSTNKPSDAVFDWFLHPLLIIKEQIKADNLRIDEEDYLGRLVLLGSDTVRLKGSSMGSPPETELKRAELDALARRLQGITKSISRYPTFRRRFDCLIKTLSEDLAKKNASSEPSEPREPPKETQKITKSSSRSTFARIFSQRSNRGKTNKPTPDQQQQEVVSIDNEIV